MSKATSINGATNGAADQIDFVKPYSAHVTIEGTAPLLFHSWNIDSIAEKAKSAKGSKSKKSDDIESYVYRISDEDRRLGIPTVNFHAAIIEAARYVQDPRSPRKSARDLAKAGIIADAAVAPFMPDTEEWDFIDRRRVTVQRAGITRERPAMRVGWRVAFDLVVTTPEYIDKALLRSLIQNAGRLVGLCDFRPTHGRFDIVAFEVSE
jgi:hypothetical protein